MLVLFLILFSIISIYITNFLYKRNMKVASVAFAVLYIYTIAWIWAVIGMDMLQFGLNQTPMSELLGSVFYHSFIEAKDNLIALPAEMLISLIVVSVTLFGCVLAFLIISGYKLCRAVKRYLCTTSPTKFAKRKVDIFKLQNCYSLIRDRIYLKFCRFNC